MLRLLEHAVLSVFFVRQPRCALGRALVAQVENFRTPNFTLVAEVLYWMVQRCAALLSLTGVDGGARLLLRVVWRLSLPVPGLPCLPRQLRSSDECT